MASFDLRRILTNWPYESGQITVRKIVGDDGTPKIQMRLDLGLLQMEPSGRPDGVRPHGCESLLEYHQGRLQEHVAKNGTDLGFELDTEECQGLRDEAMMYYHRYLSLFVLEEFSGVERDTQRNLDVLNLCRQYAGEDDDRGTLEQYRAYLIMMKTRARTHAALEQGAYKTALANVDAGLREIRDYYASLDMENNADESDEVAILDALRSELVQRMPADPLDALEKDLSTALAEERYEEAAALRDRLAAMKRQQRTTRVPRARGARSPRRRKS